MASMNMYKIVVRDRPSYKVLQIAEVYGLNVPSKVAEIMEEFPDSAIIINPL